MHCAAEPAVVAALGDVLFYLEFVGDVVAGVAVETLQSDTSPLLRASVPVADELVRHDPRIETDHHRLGWILRGDHYCLDLHLRPDWWTDAVSPAAGRLRQSWATR